MGLKFEVEIEVLKLQIGWILNLNLGMNFKSNIEIKYWNFEIWWLVLKILEFENLGYEDLVFEKLEFENFKNWKLRSVNSEF